MNIKTVITSVVSILILCSCSTRPYALKPRPDIKDSSLHCVYVSNHDWHTGLVLSSKGLNNGLHFLKKRFVHADYFEIGWGDEGFYQSNEITTGITLQAIFWPTDSVVHVVAVSGDPRVYFENSELIELQLSHEEFDSLNRFIASSFAYRTDNEAVLLKKGIYGNSQFYKGEGKYYLMNTCNTWTAKGLKSAGLQLNTSFKLTSDSVMSFLRESKQSHLKD